MEEVNIVVGKGRGKRGHIVRQRVTLKSASFAWSPPFPIKVLLI